MTDVKLKALRDVISAGESVKAGETFNLSEAAAEEAISFGLAEHVEEKPKPKPRGKHG
jgi:hypothetical protein